VPNDTLALRATQGDREAQDAVFREHIAPLYRLASRLLPPYVRGKTDMDDVVQDVMANTARRLACIDCEQEGALRAYLRRAVRHRVVDEIRRIARQPPTDELVEECHAPAPGLSPLDAAIKAQNDRRVRVALGQLSARDRQAVVLRMAHSQSYEQIAERLGSPTANAARVAVRRAVERLVRVLRVPQGQVARAGGRNEPAHEHSPVRHRPKTASQVQRCRRRSTSWRSLPAGRQVP
jgi:RNA polymerase sigma-70 factor (ECF subfamily)